jgi:hypothetical protein
VLDEFSLEVILGEFDAAVDFITYLRARETFLADLNHLVMATGEEQLVASYLLNMKGDKHWFTPAFEEGKTPHLFSFDESLYPGLRERAEYQAKKRADEPSYAWDALIEGFIRLGDPKVIASGFVQDNSWTEAGLRIIASESRFRRRMLAGTLKEALHKAKQDPSLRWLARTFTATEDSDRVYVFLIFSKSPRDDYEAYRKYRISVLHAYCRCAKLKFKKAGTFIGIALDHPAKDYKGSSEDLFIYQCDELTDEERAQTERYRQELGILPDSLEPRHIHEDEFPPAASRKQEAGLLGETAHGESAHERARRRKRNMTKASRRRNRRKK